MIAAPFLNLLSATALFTERNSILNDTNLLVDLFTALYNDGYCDCQRKCKNI